MSWLRKLLSTAFQGPMRLIDNLERDLRKEAAERDALSIRRCQLCHRTCESGTGICDECRRDMQQPG